MSKSCRLQHSVDYLKNHEERFMLKSMGRGWRSRRCSLETWTHWGPWEPVFVKLEVWFLNCIFGFVGATLHLQLLLPIILDWKGISLSLSFFSWVVNLTHRSRVQFRSKSKIFFFPSRLSCKNWGFFFSILPHYKRDINIFFPSGLQFGKSSRGTWNCFSAAFQCHSFCHIS